MSISKIKSRKINKDTNVTDKREKVTVKKENKKTLDDVLGNVDSSRSVALERRVRNTNKSLKGKKIKAANLEEKKLDQAIEREDNLSLAAMILIIVGCFVVGSIIGYMLYRIAMNSSNALLVVPYLFK